MDFHKQRTLPELEIGTIEMPAKIGPYKIESVLNKGGMSLLYLGTDPKTGAPIAIKVLPPKYLQSKEMTSRFLKEAEIIGMTEHPNIVKLLGQGEWEQGLYIAMEFIQGISLRQFIKEKSLSEKKALEIILAVAYALCHLHVHGVIHRDLKPENILITENGNIKVIDFGIAQLASSEIERIKGSTKILGTPVYMSPEQKENPENVTIGSDIYSLGIVAYELILGRLSHGIVHLSLLAKPLRKILEKALNRNPKERYGDVVDFITDISEYMRSLAEKEKEPPEELLHLMKETRAILLPHSSPRWPSVEIGIAIKELTAPNGLYLDFFTLPDHRLAVVLAKPKATGIIALLYSSILRGKMHMATLQSMTPMQMIHILNRSIQEDPIKQTFTFSLLLLNPDKNQLTYIACDSTPLLHLPQESNEVRHLSTPTPALGAAPDSAFLETTANWNVGDALYLSSEPIDTQILAQMQSLLAQHQASHILQQTVSEHLQACVVISRLF